MNCAGCDKELEVGDRYIEDTARRRSTERRRGVMALYYGCCGAEILSAPTTVFDEWPDGRPRAWEIRCPCGRTVTSMTDGGTLDLAALRDEQPEPDGRFEVFPIKGLT